MFPPGRDRLTINSSPNRIGHAAHDDRNYAGCLFGCASWRRTYYDDDVNLEPNQVVRELLESIRIPIAVASLDRYVSNPRRKPSSPQPVVKNPTVPGVSVEPGFNTPIRGSFPFCWAFAGEAAHAAAAPPTSVMNSRRFITNPKPRRWHLSGLKQARLIGAKKPSRALPVSAGPMSRRSKSDIEFASNRGATPSLNNRNCLAAFSCPFCANR